MRHKPHGGGPFLGSASDLAGKPELGFDALWASVAGNLVSFKPTNKPRRKRPAGVTTARKRRSATCLGIEFSAGSPSAIARTWLPPSAGRRLRRAWRDGTNTPKPRAELKGDRRSCRTASLTGSLADPREHFEPRARGRHLGRDWSADKKFPMNHRDFTRTC